MSLHSILVNISAVPKKKYSVLLQHEYNVKHQISYLLFFTLAHMAGINFELIKVKFTSEINI